MTDAMVLGIGRDALTVTLLMCGPLLGVSLVVGLVVSIFQAVTQINESTLTFVPKIIAIFGVMAVAGTWMMGTMVSYTGNLFSYLATMTR